MTSIHSDNGHEFLNHVTYNGLKANWTNAGIFRSYPNRKNHNAHIEQKNGAVVRMFLRNMRLDYPELIDPLKKYCTDVCLWNNYCSPCKMLISKKQRLDTKGFIKVYDKPRTPAERVLESPDVPEYIKNSIRKQLSHKSI